jgi:hypothetical protein
VHCGVWAPADALLPPPAHLQHVEVLLAHRHLERIGHVAAVAAVAAGGSSGAPQRCALHRVNLVQGQAVRGDLCTRCVRVCVYASVCVCVYASVCVCGGGGGRVWVCGCVGAWHLGARWPGAFCLRAACSACASLQRCAAPHSLVQGSKRCAAAGWLCVRTCHSCPAARPAPAASGPRGCAPAHA